MGFDHPVAGVAFPRTAAIVEKEPDDAQRFGHGPRQRCRQIVRSALHPYRLLQGPGHTPRLRSGSYKNNNSYESLAYKKTGHFIHSPSAHLFSASQNNKVK